MKGIFILKGGNVEINGVPETISVLPIGHVVSSKGEFDVDEESFRAMKAQIAQRGVDLVVDYEHQTLKGVEAPAAGWVKELKLEDGCIKAVVEWTARGAEYLKNREYRYLSPVVSVRKADGKATEEQIMEALSACVAENKSLKEGQKPPAADENTVANKAVCELLGLKAGAPAADVTAKIMELKAGTIDGVNLAEELKALKAQNARRDADAAVELALKAGKITPAQKEWATSYALSDPKGFAAFAEKAPQVVPMGAVGFEDIKNGGAPIDAATVMACKQLGVDPEEAKKYMMKED